jgi:hypothetical protein
MGRLNFSRLQGLEWAVSACLCIVALSGTAFAQRSEPYHEHIVKAAFLYRFTGYMEWPAEAMQTDAFTIAVLGDMAVADELKRSMEQHTVKDLPVRVRSISGLHDATNIHVLYIGPEYAGNLRQAIEAMALLPTVIVTDHPRGLDEGSMVNFLLADRRVRFEVSLPAAQRAGIKVSSELLAVAARVRGTFLFDRCRPALEHLRSSHPCPQRVAAR